MPVYKIDEIATILEAETHILNSSLIRNLIIDSRKIASPDDSLFFAIIGERNNGHNYIDDLYKKGVRNFVVQVNTSIQSFEQANFIFVSDTTQALQKLVAFHRQRFSFPIIGITGSNGKTIIKEWIFQVLESKLNIIRNPRSYNSQVGVPLSVWHLEKENQLGIFEAGISQPNEMLKLQKIILPEIGVFTMIGDAHQENFISIEQKIEEKLILFDQVKTLIYCKDHIEIDQAIQNKCKGKIINLFNWSLKGDAVVKITRLEQIQNTTSIEAVYKSKKYTFEIPFSDNASIENAIHVFCVLLYLDYDSTFISDRMKTLVAVGMRLEMKKGMNNCLIINDSYNSDLNSLLIALDFLNQQQHNKKKTLILSDILQSGKNNKELYREVAELVSNKKIDRIIGIGLNIMEYKNLFLTQKLFFPTTQDFILNISSLHFSDECILLKGARSFEFENISRLLEDKLHRTILEVNMNNIVHNLNYFRSLILPQTKILVMVKAFSYGSGTHEIAHLLQYHRVDYLGVAFADEGIVLRKAGIHLPIIVMNPDVMNYDLMMEYNLEPVIYDLNGLVLFSDLLQKNGIRDYPIHIKIDTGMNRLGFKQGDIKNLIETIKNEKNCKVSSIFSHLAASDDENQDSFTLEQIQLFDKISNVLMNELNYPINRHILNSAGVERFPQYQFNMIRLGIGLYGCSAVDQLKLKHISTLKSYIAQIKEVIATETVGYGRRGKVNKTSKIAIIPIGYADGLNRRLSNGVGHFIVKNKRVPIIGSICMDMCMIDVSNIEAKVGDEVIIFGQDLTVSEIASQIGTIPYEVLTSVSARVKRIYFQE